MHPFGKHRDHIVQRERVSHIAHGHKHRASGGRATHKDEKQDRSLIKEMIHDEAEGKRAKHRRDRPMRAKGGKVGHKKHSNVTVNVLSGHGGPQPVPVPMPPPGLGAPAPGSPPPMGGAGLPPMPPRKSGGRISSDGHTAKPMRAKGGSVKSGPAWEEGRKAGTQVQHSDALSVTEKNMNRGKPITFKAGGKVKSFYAYGGKVRKDDGGSVSDKDIQMDYAKDVASNAMNRSVSAGMRANPNASYDPRTGKVSGFRRGGKVEAPQGIAKATKLSGGAGGGIGRREKAKEYGGRPMREVDGAK